LFYSSKLKIFLGKLRKESFRFLVFSGLSTLLIYLLQFYLGNILPMSSFGQFKYAMLAVSLSGLITLGYRDEYLLKALQSKGNIRELHKRYFGNFFYLVLVPLFFTAFLIGLFGNLFIALTLVYILAVQYISFSEVWYFHTNIRSKIALRKLIKDLSILISIFLLYTAGESDLLGVLFVFSLFSVLLLIFLQWENKLPTPSYKSLIMVSAKDGLIIQFNNYSNQIFMSLERIVIAFFCLDSVFGSYSYIMLPFNAILIVGGIIGTYLYKNVVEDNGLLTKKRILEFLLYSFLCAILGTLFSYIVIMQKGEEFYERAFLLLSALTVFANLFFLLIGQSWSRLKPSSNRNALYLNLLLISVTFCFSYIFNNLISYLIIVALISLIRLLVLLKLVFHDISIRTGVTGYRR